MADRNSSPADTREQAVHMRATWANIGNNNNYGDLTLEDIDASIAALDQAARTISSLEDQMVSARNEYWERRHALWGKIKRTKLAVRLRYGDESDEYERFGGTRPSQRRRPRLVATRTESKA